MYACTFTASLEKPGRRDYFPGLLCLGCLPIDLMVKDPRTWDMIITAWCGFLKDRHLEEGKLEWMVWKLPSKIILEDYYHTTIPNHSINLTLTMIMSLPITSYFISVSLRSNDDDGVFWARKMMMVGCRLWCVVIGSKVNCRVREYLRQLEPNLDYTYGVENKSSCERYCNFGIEECKKKCQDVDIPDNELWLEMASRDDEYEESVRRLRRSYATADESRPVRRAVRHKPTHVHCCAIMVSF
ncbi:predicted protein [Sclerotinia sclerotiorum 1980 UF-70]|uniref:Uncharacterized protein n=1 Tax=Sclerotinia sclerotiorum (strain ATCC 18683 / 1980 / Ss-1) TaxID=665079 RepID=A7ERY1_SCLS1|nr:predicted protein [Sclerotinia sclerotiorum 1980 UF-70]EDN92223.1 predicted protein [Sclerotinia sclerotiorum 1980 UF-70]